ncbi:MAG: T9SS type A sorting domain-containing protein [Calditrichaeota bacterium]|nr:T9SS type A sorting domain-containing protein [Calditrichota bacterium]
MKTAWIYRTLVLLILVLTMPCLCQPEVEWVKEFDYDQHTYYEDIIAHEDGTYTLGGTQYVGNGQNQRTLPIVTTINSNAEIVWSNTYGDSTQHYVRSMVKTNDGSYLIAGDVANINLAPRDDWDGPTFLSKISPDGEELWTTSYDCGVVLDLVSCRDNSIGVLGYYERIDHLAGTILLRTDEHGNESDRKTWDGGLYHMLGTTIETDDGNLVLSGILWLDEVGMLIDVQKIDQRWHNRIFVQWMNLPAGHYGLPEVIEDQDGNYIVYGFCNASMETPARLYMLKVDNDGRIIWFRNHDLGQYRCTGKLVINGNNHPLLIASREEIDDFENKQLIFIEFDSDGILISQSTNDQVRIRYFLINETPDGGYIILSKSNNKLLVKLSNPNSISTKEENDVPSNFQISSIYPNPFNSSTTISYKLPIQSHTTIGIYNTQGQLIDVLIEELMSAGQHSVVWDAEGVSAGVYLVRILETGGGMKEIQKVILVK